MNADTLNFYSYISENMLGDEVKAVCVNFPGLNSTLMKSSLDYNDIRLAHDGMLFIYPYVNPWNWMNEKTVEFVDEVLDAAYAKLTLKKDIQLLFRGGSMGGYSALTYGMFSRYRPTAIFANCPVTDLYSHCTERPDLPRTIHDAMGDYGDITKVLQARSPNYHPEMLPNCRYLIVHGLKDKAVNKNVHSDKLVAIMRSRGMNVEYIEDANMEHCSPMSYDTITTVEQFCKQLLADK